MKRAVLNGLVGNALAFEWKTLKLNMSFQLVSNKEHSPFLLHFPVPGALLEIVLVPLCKE